MKFESIKKTVVAVMSAIAVSAYQLAAQCPIEPSMATRSGEWDGVFTQDGPGKGLEPAGSPGWTGGDSAYSILLPNGDSAFYFGDSYVAEAKRTSGDGSVTRHSNGLRTLELNCFPSLCDPPAVLFTARNTIVIRSKDGKRLHTLVGPLNDKGLSTSYFKEPSEGLNYWAEDSIVLPTKIKGRKRVLTFLLKVDGKMELHGLAIAQLDPNTLAVEKIVAIKNLPDLETHWGSSLLVEGSRLYIYGKRSAGGQKLPFAARTNADLDIESLADASTWEVNDSGKWTGNFASAKPIVPPKDSISDEFDIVKFTINNRPVYVMVAIDTSVPFGSWKDIVLYSSCSPDGPFTGKQKIYEMPESDAFTVPGLPANERLKAHLVVYNPHIHQQLSGSGKILVSYSMNRSHNSDSIYIDGYRPRFIQVPVRGLR